MKLSPNLSGRMLGGHRLTESILLVFRLCRSQTETSVDQYLQQSSDIQVLPFVQVRFLLKINLPLYKYGRLMRLRVV